MAESGVVFPLRGSAGRSTSALGRDVVAAALRGTDAPGSRSAQQETDWRRHYLLHFRRLLEAGLDHADDARRIAADGLAALHTQMRFVRSDGEEVGLADAFAADALACDPLETVVVTGKGAVDRELSLPYAGQRLRGDELRRQLDAWVVDGVIEPSCAEAVRQVAANPDWLDLSDLRLVALGAAAEMGPLRSILRWGGDVVAVDLPRAGLWRDLLAITDRYAGRMHVPTTGAKRGAGDDLSERAGADLLHHLPAVTDWLGRFDGRLVLGNYVYADGPLNVRVAMAVDALTSHLLSARQDIGLAFLATPTDTFAVPLEAVAQAEVKYRQRSTMGMLRRPLRLLSGGRLLRRNYAPDSAPGICDSLVAQQGPNYALAKRLQRWRATHARTYGVPVSLKVAPPTRTRSVVKNRALAAAYAGAHFFGVEVFEPATSNTLMAALLVHDLRRPTPPRAHPWMDEADGAAHGGLWRAPYSPRSALGLAALIGIGGARG